MKIKERRSHNFVDMTGKVFGALTVLCYEGTSDKQLSLWRCLCVCGNSTVVKGNNLRRGHHTSCGCLRTSGKAHLVHGLTKSPEYKIFSGAKNRCRNPHNSSYPKYGGRGIEFRFASIRDFLDEVGMRPTPSHSLERIDNNGHYEAGNVMWTTPLCQANNKRNNRRATLDGITRTLPQWSSASGIQTNTISKRLRLGWCARCAIFNAMQEKCTHKHQLQSSATCTV